MTEEKASALDGLESAWRTHRESFESSCRAGSFVEPSWLHEIVAEFEAAAGRELDRLRDSFAGGATIALVPETRNAAKDVTPADETIDTPPRTRRTGQRFTRASR
jgi:hypothetical protein